MFFKLLDEEASNRSERVKLVDDVAVEFIAKPRRGRQRAEAYHKSWCSPVTSQAFLLTRQ
jgi:hypothetical protein